MFVIQHFGKLVSHPNLVPAGDGMIWGRLGMNHIDTELCQGAHCPGFMPTGNYLWCSFSSLQDKTRFYCRSALSGVHWPLEHVHLLSFIEQNFAIWGRVLGILWCGMHLEFLCCCYSCFGHNFHQKGHSSPLVFAGAGRITWLWEMHEGWG